MKRYHCTDYGEIEKGKEGNKGNEGNEELKN